MAKKLFLKRFAALLCLIVTVAVVISAFSACDKKKSDNGNSDLKKITVTVTDDKGENTVFNIETTASTLRKALEGEKLIEGDESQYGMYVKIVNGIEADYDKNGAYWSFNQDGVMLNTSVDDTKIKDGDSYEIVYTK